MTTATATPTLPGTIEDLEREGFRCQRWAIRRAYPELYLHILHRAFDGHGTAASEFLGFTDRSVVRDAWTKVGLSAMGREAPRNGRNVNQFDQWPARSLEEWDEAYERLSEDEEKALVYDWNLPEKAARGLLMPIADIHCGHVACDWKRFKRLVEWIKRHPNTRWFLAGDSIDLHCKSGPGSKSEQFLPLDIAKRLLHKHLSSVVTQGICVFDGNHERRLNRAEDPGYSPAQELAQMLELPFFAALGGHILHRVGDQQYKHFHHHGAGAARTDGAKLNRGESIAAIARADFVTVGHLHFEATVRLIEREIDAARADGGEAPVIDVQKHLAMCPSFHGYRGYPVDMALKPSALGVTGIELETKKKDVRANV